MNERLTVSRRITRVLKNFRIWLLAALLIAGMVMAFQAKRPIALDQLPVKYHGNTISWLLPLDRYNGPTILELQVSEMVGPAKASIYLTTHKQITTTFTPGSERLRRFWLVRSSSNIRELRLVGLSSQAEITGRLVFPKIGKLIHIRPLFMGSALLIVLSFSLILSLLYHDDRIAIYGFGALALLLVLATHFLGLALVVRFPLLALSALSLMIMIAVSLLVFPSE